MSRVRFRPKAESDLLKIRRYTIERWGSAKADDYIRSIAAALDRAVSDKNRGRPVDFAPNLWRIRVGSHIAFYRPYENYVDVVRILHERMDPLRHLSNKPK